MASNRVRALGASFLVAFGCGSAARPADAPPASAEGARPASAEQAPTSSTAEAAPSPQTKPDATSASESAKSANDTAAKGGDDAKPADTNDGDKGSSKPREVTFEMTSGGLVINVEGVRLEPKAEPLRLEDPESHAVGWGVRLLVRATATDKHVHRFTRPEHGPLMVAAEIDRKGKKERIGDERKGEGEDTLTEGTPITLARDFKKSIWSGQSVTLFVGLWGLGRDTEEKRLVRKLFVVKMIAGNKKPQPVVSPPD